MSFSPEAAPPPLPPVSELVQEYVMLRDKKKLSEEWFDGWAKANYGSRMDELETLLLASLNNVGAENIKTEHGTVYKSLAQSITIADHAAFQRFVIGGEHWGLVDWRAGKKAIQEFTEEHGGQMPPGLSTSSIYKVNVRRA